MPDLRHQYGHQTESKLSNLKPHSKEKHQPNTFLDIPKHRPQSHHSCKESRNGLRLQTKAYERQDESDTLKQVRSRNYRLSNVYVDKLQNFYQPYGNKNTVPNALSSSNFNFRPSSDDNISQKHTGNNYHLTSHPALQKSSLSTGMRQNNPSPKTVVSNSYAYQSPSNLNEMSVTPFVTITLTSPNGRTTTADENVLSTISRKMKRAFQPIPSQTSIQDGKSHLNGRGINYHKAAKPSSSKSGGSSSAHLLPRIPPPVPIILSNTRQTSPQYSENSNKVNPRQDLELSAPSRSLSSTEARILQAVQNLESKTQKSDPHQLTSYYDRKRRLHRAATDRNAVKMSLPCRVGCCYCVYASLLGPVKIYLTRSKRPKKEPCLLGIKDGNGKPAIPVSRKEDITGLVYDAHNHSFYPPTKGQRPLFPGNARSSRQGAPVMVRTTVTRGKSSDDKKSTGKLLHKI